MVKIETFKAGTFIKQADFKSFKPNLINNCYYWEDRELTRLNEQAALSIGKLDAYADLVPDVNHFI